MNGQRDNKQNSRQKNGGKDSASKKNQGQEKNDQANRSKDSKKKATDGGKEANSNRHEHGKDKRNQRPSGAQKDKNGDRRRDDRSSNIYHQNPGAGRQRPAAQANNISGSAAIDPKILKFCKSLVDVKSAASRLLPSDADLFKKSFHLLAANGNLRVADQFGAPLLRTYLNITETATFAPSAKFVIEVMKNLLSTNSPNKDADANLVMEVTTSRLNRSISMKTITSKEEKDEIVKIFANLISQVTIIFATSSSLDLVQNWLSVSAEYTRTLESYEPVASSPSEAEAVIWFRNPTIGWLLELSRSPPQDLRESYDSTEEYNKTLTSLWMYMTFYWGIGAVWPKCTYGALGSGNQQTQSAPQRCGNPLLRCLKSPTTCTMRIRRNGKVEYCNQLCIWSCTRDRHDAICDNCLHEKQQRLLGPGGEQRFDASTDIYDAEISSIVIKSEATTLVLKDVSSRKPPEKVNWRTSYRLQSAAMVAVVSLPFKNMDLQRDMRIFLGEIVKHDVKEDEYARRARKLLDVRLLCRTDAVVLDSGYETPFIPNGRVAVIDMRVFVPQVVSVLGTLSDPLFNGSLARIPFRDAFCGVVKPLPTITSPWDGELIYLLHEAVRKSNIRAFKNLSADRQQEYVDIISRIPVIRSLDRTQRMAFIYGLTCDLHITQGPPGTGKSYVGVCLVLAFIELKKLLLQQGSQVGPILSLSYKNHALDEFLTDCQNNDEDLQRPTRLIRLGKPDNAALLNFTERNSTLESKAQKELDRRVGKMKLLKVLLSNWKSSFGIIMDTHELGKHVVRALMFIAILFEFRDPEEAEEVFEMLSTFVSGDASDDFEYDEFIPLLYLETSHWIEVRNDFAKIIGQWILGKSLPPRCQFVLDANGDVCNSCAFQGFPFCSKHKCDNPTCTEHIASSKHSFCRNHCCSIKNCFKEVIADFKFCRDHACCVCAIQPRTQGGKACQLHACSVTSCRNAALVPLSFCMEHTCCICQEIDFLTAESQAVVGSAANGFCASHKCEMRECENARQSYLVPGCAGHTCQVCDSLIDGINGRKLCDMHSCTYIDPDTDATCHQACIQVGPRTSPFCAVHTCLGCAEAGEDTLLTEETFAPRFTCRNHNLCDEILDNGDLCPFLCATDSHRCRYHEETAQNFNAANFSTCCGLKKNGNRCKSKDYPPNFPEDKPWFCNVHKDQAKSYCPKNASVLGELNLINAPSLQNYPTVKGKKSKVLHASRKDNFASSVTTASGLSKRTIVSCTTCKQHGTTDTILLCGESLLCPIDCRKWQRKNETPPPPQVGATAITISNQSESMGTPTAAAVATASVDSSARPVVVLPKERAVAAEGVLPPTRKERVEFADDDIAGGFMDADAYGGDADELEVNPAHYQNNVPALPIHQDGQIEEEDDNDDDLQVNEAAEHNRQIYAEEGDDDNDLDDENVYYNEEDKIFAQMGLKYMDFVDLLNQVKKWSWALSPEERLKEAQVLIFTCMKLLAEYMSVAERYVEDARREKAEATAIALKRATLVGGTVVGVAKRLAALRAAEPFVIIVEEACEVMEPTLVAVLAVESVQKLELVGDHMQLPAFVDQCWFNIETTIPSIKRSLFERLVKSGGGFVSDDSFGGYAHVRQQPRRTSASTTEATLHTILDMQRRMTPNIANLTKGEYAHMISIIDHAKTTTQKMGDKLSKPPPHFATLKSLWANPRSPPGVLSNIFFWNMVNNSTSRPKVGLSACNENEALAVAQLVEYFLLCGVPPGCITVITPYQGQKREIIDIMRKRKILPKRTGGGNGQQMFFDDESNVLVSTVDRYQGDENDIVILSLVRAQSGNRFVTFANRFIVAASRARLGFYIVGSVEAVVPKDKPAPPHWKRFVDHLTRHNQIGDQLQLCCPCHHPNIPTPREGVVGETTGHGTTIKSISSENSRTKARLFPTTTTWFCQELCTTLLPNCNHACNLPCHVPKALEHRKKCEVSVKRPCATHVTVPLFCGDYQLNTNPFRCEVEEIYRRRDCQIHDMRLSCAVYQDYYYGQKAWPPCQEKMTMPFIHPECKHSFPNLTCDTYRQYEKSPPSCTEPINIQLGCSHLVHTECRKKKRFLCEDYKCQQVVTVSRPRCLHKAQTRCVIADTLLRQKIIWQHEPRDPRYPDEIENLVLDVRYSYGREESDIVPNFTGKCQEKVAIKRDCGHILQKIPCQQAYLWVADPSLMPTCSQTRPIECPFCFSILQIACSKSNNLDDLRFFYNIVLSNGVEENSYLISRQTILQSAELQRQLHLLLDHCSKCITKITLRRRCHPLHVVTMSCHEFLLHLAGKRHLSDCEDKRVEKRTDCGHDITIACNLWQKKQIHPCREQIHETYTDPRCGCQSVIRRCGDLMALRQDPTRRDCPETIRTHHIRCGHFVEILCKHRSVVETFSEPGMIIDSSNNNDQKEGKEDAEPIEVQQSQVYCLPCHEAPRCAKPVTFVRKYCQHRLYNVPCGEAFSWTQLPPRGTPTLHSLPPPCQVKVLISTHPVCGIHEALWFCHIYEALLSWNPRAIYQERSLSLSLAIHPLPIRINNDGNNDNDDVDATVGEQDVLIVEDDALEKLPLLTLALPSSISWEDVKCREPLVVQMPHCQHLRRFACHDFFSLGNQGKLRCEEIVPHQCNRCQLTRTITCWEKRYQRPEQLDRACTSLVFKPCSYCRVNQVQVTCQTDLVECRAKVIKQLPCGHSYTWQCQPEHVSVEASHDGVSNFNPQCLECCVLSWEKLLTIRLTAPQVQQVVADRIAWIQQEDGLYDGISVKEENWLDISEIVLKQFHEEIRTHVQKITLAMRKGTHSVVPPPLRPGYQYRRPSVSQIDNAAVVPSSNGLSTASAAAVESNFMVEDEEEAPQDKDSILEWTKYMIDHLLDVTFIANVPNKHASADDRHQRFVSKASPYGMGVTLQGVSSSSVMKVLQTATAENIGGGESTTDFWIALVYRGDVLVPSQAKDFFLRQEQPNPNVAMKNALLGGFSGVIVGATDNSGTISTAADRSGNPYQELWDIITSASRQQPSYQHIVWNRQHILPVSVVRLSLQAQCGICFDMSVRHHDYGTWCEDGHFVCWSCLKDYAQSANEVDTMVKATARGQLPCYINSGGGNTCNHAFDLLKLGSAKAPLTVFQAIKCFEFNLKLKTESEEIRKQEKRMYEREMQRLLALNERDRQVECLVKEIQERILPLRCPRCDSVWDDFDACCAVTCIYRNCGHNFCGICTQPGDHGHVARCPWNPNPGEVFCDRVTLKDVHNKVRVDKVQRRLQQERDPDIVRDVLLKVARDFQQLGINYPNTLG